MAGNESHVEGPDTEGSHMADKLGKACRTCLRGCVHTEPWALDTSCLALGLLGIDALADEYSLVNDGLGGGVSHAHV